MAANRFYSSTAVATTLSGAATNTTPTLNVGALTGYPTTYPYTAIIDRGEASEEAVQVTNASGTTLTVVRGVDGTSAVAHTSGATFEHGITARDFREPQEHLGNTANVHGIAGEVVGTTDSQTLQNKTLEDAILTTPTLDVPDITDFTDAQHDHADVNDGGLLAFAALTQAGTAYTPVWTSPSGTDPTINNGSIVGRYFKLGKLVIFSLTLTVGSTTNKGTGGYAFSLPPFTSRNATPVHGDVNARFSGHAFVLGGGHVVINSTTLTVLFPSSSTPGDFNNSAATTYPFDALATADVLTISGWYEAA